MKQRVIAPDVVTLNTALRLFLPAPPLPLRLEAHFLLLTELGALGAEPDAVTYTALIQAFAQRGLLPEAQKTLTEMRDLGLKPGQEAFTILIGLYTRKNHVLQATRAIHTMMREGITPTRESLAQVIWLGSP